MIKKGRFLVIVTIIAMVVSMICMSGIAAPKKIRIGVSTNGLGNTFNRNAYYGVLNAAKKKGVTIIAIDGKGEINKMYNDMENLINQKVDAIINICGTLTAMVPVIEHAEKVGIPVISLDAGMVDGVAALVTSNNWEIGAKMATYLLNSIDGQGNVFSFINPDHYAVRTRGTLFKAALTEYPGVKLAGEHRVIWPNSIPDARNAMENLMKATPDVKGVFCGFDLPAIGVAQAIEAAGRKDIIVVGCDGDEQALQYIKKGGPIVATIVQDPGAMGKAAVDVAINLANGGVLKNKTVYVAATLVTKENVGEFLKK